MGSLDLFPLIILSYIMYEYICYCTGIAGNCDDNECWIGSCDLIEEWDENRRDTFGQWTSACTYCKVSYVN